MDPIQKDIQDLKKVQDLITDNLETSDELQRLVSQIELRIMELEERYDS